MSTYHFDCQLTPEDGGTGSTSGEIDAPTSDAAWDFVRSMLVMRGEWTCRIRCGSRWLKSRIFIVDRDPDVLIGERKLQEGES